MDQTQVVIASLVIAAVLVALKALGVFKGSFSESLNDRLDANYVRCGLFTWELSISAKGVKVGIRQGRFLLPVAMARASLVKQGKTTIL